MEQPDVVLVKNTGDLGSNLKSNSGVHGIDLSLNLGSSIGAKLPRQIRSQGPFKVPGLPVIAPSFMGWNSCSCCLSNSHLRSNCTWPVRCGLCFQLDHIASFCRYLPRFPGLS